MAALAKKAVRDESLDDGTFVAYLMLENKLTRKEIYAVVGEFMTASVDTVNTDLVNMVNESGLVKPAPLSKNACAF